MTAQVIPFVTPPPIEPKCSFCQTPKSKCGKLIAGSTGATICDRCIKHAKERMNSGNQ